MKPELGKTCGKALVAWSKPSYYSRKKAWMKVQTCQHCQGAPILHSEKGSPHAEERRLSFSCHSNGSAEAKRTHWSQKCWSAMLWTSWSPWLRLHQDVGHVRFKFTWNQTGTSRLNWFSLQSHKRCHQVQLVGICLTTGSFCWDCKC